MKTESLFPTTENQISFMEWYVFLKTRKKEVNLLLPGDMSPGADASVSESRLSRPLTSCSIALSSGSETETGTDETVFFFI